MIRTQSEMKIEIREAMRGGPGSASIRHLFEPKDFKAAVRLCAEITLKPGSGIGTHQHLTEDEVYFILRGEGLLNDGTTQTRVKTGDSILTGRGESHSILNDSTSDLVLLAVICCYT